LLRLLARTGLTFTEDTRAQIAACNTHSAKTSLACFRDHIEF
jgi:hypothetical protein